MAGMGDDSGMNEDWAPNPSPITFFSNLLDEDFGTRSFSHFLGGNRREASAQESDIKKTVTGSNEEDGGAEIQPPGNPLFRTNGFGVQKSSMRGGLADRMAARGGFNAPKLNTTGIRKANMSSSPSEILSPYLTIPPGLSPTTLLESPVFLSNSMALPSPTTGKISFAQSNHTNSGSAVSDETKDCSFEDITPEPFAFKPHPESRSSYFSSVENKGLPTFSCQQQSSNIQLEQPVRAGNPESGLANFQNQQNFSLQAGFSNSSERKDACDDITLNKRVSDSYMVNEQSSPLDDQPDGEADPRGEFSFVAAGAPAEDGYNWRKYGQKHVKGSEYPRSYYKCTHLNCRVKKKVERNLEGHITEIIYKGAHNHPKPPPNRRSAVCHPFNDPQLDGSEHPGTQAEFHGKPPLVTSQNGTGGHGWRSNGLEPTSSASGVAELYDPSTSMHTQDGSRFESPETVDVTSTLSNDGDEDDCATHGSASLGGNGEGDETESKRRKLDVSTVEMSAASRSVREPRVVVQTTSEVDILDDGYRWRKYGQKVVKGNPNPRSYYKCTNPGCMVRKHVERASHDLKSVITTYEGKHNHDVPAARNSSNHASSLASSTTNTSVPQTRGMHCREEPTQDNMIPLGVYGLPGRGPLGPATSFGYGTPQQSLSSLGITGLSSMAQMKMPALPHGRSFMGIRQDMEGRFMVPKGEPKEESLLESGMLMSSRGSVYHQMPGRLPLGRQF